MSKFKKLTFLKVLTTIAWADGEVTNSELNILKSFYRRFGLEKAEIQELNRCLRTPLTKPEQETMFKQLTAELNSSKERKEILKFLKEMAQADNKIQPEEQELLDQYKNWLESETFTKRSLGKLRNLLMRTIFKPAREINHSLENQFKNIVQKKFELKVRRGKYKIRWSGDRAYLACLFGTIMASLANSDGEFSEKERKALRSVLTTQFQFNNEELALLCEIAHEHSDDFDFYEITTEMNRLVTHNNRLQFMESLFEVATADGSMDHVELEELRRITKALHIPHKDFINCKVRHRDNMN